MLSNHYNNLSWTHDIGQPKRHSPGPHSTPCAHPPDRDWSPCFCTHHSGPGPGWSISMTDWELQSQFKTIQSLRNGCTYCNLLFLFLSSVTRLYVVKLLLILDVLLHIWLSFPSLYYTWLCHNVVWFLPFSICHKRWDGGKHLSIRHCAVKPGLSHQVYFQVNSCQCSWYRTKPSLPHRTIFTTAKFPEVPHSTNWNKTSRCFSWHFCKRWGNWKR